MEVKEEGKFQYDWFIRLFSTKRKWNNFLRDYKLGRHIRTDQLQNIYRVFQ